MHIPFVVEPVLAFILGIVILIRPSLLEILVAIFLLVYGGIGIIRML